MNLWQKFEKKNFSAKNEGFSLHFEEGIEPELKKFYLDFSRWLRKNYVFPIHINVYILNEEKVRLMNGNLAYGSFKYFPKRAPRIKIPSRVGPELLNEFSLDDIYEQIISSFVHELTHYFQYAAGLEQTNAASERQANYFRYRIIEEYYASCHD